MRMALLAAAFALMATPVWATEKAAHHLQTIASVVAGASLSTAEKAAIARAWETLEATPAQRRALAQSFAKIAGQVSAPAAPYPRTLMRDKAAAIVHCAVDATSVDWPVQIAMATAASAHAPVVAAACAGATPYVVTAADIEAFLAEQRFFASKTGIDAKVWNDERSSAAWTNDLTSAFSTAQTLGQERLAHSESRWLLTRTVWDAADAETRVQILDIVRKGAAKRGALSDGVLTLHATLILGGAKVQLNAQMHEFLAAAGVAMSGQAVADTALREIRTW